jgi:hypothetical protein
MIIGSRIDRRTKRQRELTEVKRGVFVAKNANEPKVDSDFFERSPIMDILEDRSSSKEDS